MEVPVPMPGSTTDPAQDSSVDAAGPTALGAPTPPTSDPLERQLARAAAEAALFGDAEPVKVGRYRVIERAGAGGMGVVWSAWDPELNRGVALKLASSGNEAARKRARDEGRALARLSHPNVVPIYDVIDVDEGVMLVMELVTGRTLRRVAGDGASVAELVRAYRQAGEGLAAAHRAGLIHRDFKPDNAILGADGRVRVLDFGLAHEVPPEGSAASAEIAGTPRYMAPEQRKPGVELTAAVDQFALCVALREAVSGRGAVPRWLQPILARGTAEAPADRWPSMDALLRELALDPATRWRRRGAIGLGVAAIGGSIAAFGLGRAAQEESPCEGGPALIAASWGNERRAAVSAHLAGIATPYAADIAPRLLAGLDGYAADWAALHGASCKAHRRGEISAPLLDRRMTCLARRRAALDAVGELATTAPADGLAGLVLAAGALPDLSACDDDEALLAAVEPPPPAAAAEAAAIGDLISRVDVERDAGRTDDAVRDADEAVKRATALAYRPLIARAHLARGRIALILDRGTRGSDDFAIATREAIAAGDEPLAIEAYARQAYAIATTTDPARATDGLVLVEAMAERAGGRAGFARALLHQNLGGVALARGDRVSALAAFERSREVAAGLPDGGGSGAIELSGNLFNLLLVIDDPARRAALGDELVAIRTRLIGARHPLTLKARVMAAELLDDDAAMRAKLTEACSDVARYHATMGVLIAECGSELAALAAVDGDLAAAGEAASLVVAAAAHGVDADQVAMARAYRRLADGEAAAAAADFDALIARLDTGADANWWVTLAAADALIGAAVAHRAAGNRAATLARLDDAAARFERIAANLPEPTIRRRRGAVAAVRRSLPATGSP